VTLQPSTAPSPRLVPSLRRLRREIDRRWPDRERDSDGWIGDAAHAVRPSDHNPDERGRVHAIDITSDGVDCRYLVWRAIAHPSTEYVIWSNTIWSRSHDFWPRAYYGPNPHLRHMHVSVSHTPRGRRNRRRWLRA
jgi:hypothetical protein